MSGPRVAVYPGSFDPITSGHVDIVRRVHQLFDELILVVGQSSSKKYLFTPEERKQLIEQCLGPVAGVRVEIHSGLTVDFLKRQGARVLVRGLRTVSDFDSELTMAHMNSQLSPDVETLLVFASPKFLAISSNMVKEVAALGGSLAGVVPEPVERALKAKLLKAKS